MKVDFILYPICFRFIKRTVRLRFRGFNFLLHGFDLYGHDLRQVFTQPGLECADAVFRCQRHHTGAVLEPCFGVRIDPHPSLFP